MLRAVRPAEPSDAPALAALHVRAWQAAFRGLIDDEQLDAHTVASRARLWGDLLDAASDADPTRLRTLVAIERATLLGFCSFAWMSRDADAAPLTGEVVALYVEPRLWRRGVGTALLHAAMSDLRAADCAHVTLWTLADAAASRRFYARHGFQPDGAEQELHGARAIRLSAALPAG